MLAGLLMSSLTFARAAEAAPRPAAHPGAGAGIRSATPDLTERVVHRHGGGAHALGFIDVLRLEVVGLLLKIV